MPSSTEQIRPITHQDEWLEILAELAERAGELEIRRGDVRFYVQGQAALDYSTPAMPGAPHRRVYGSLLQVSPSGIMVRTQTEIPAEAHLEVDLEIDGHPVHVSGVAVHATNNSSGYKIGILLHFPESANTASTNASTSAPHPTKPGVHTLDPDPTDDLLGPQPRQIRFRFATSQDEETKSARASFWTQMFPHLSPKHLLEAAFCLAVLSAIIMLIGRVLLTAFLS